MTMRKNNLIPILSITGSDGTGGSGIQADIKTCNVLGGYALSVITAVTVQDTRGIQSTHPISAEVIDIQLKSIIVDIPPQAVKVGMLCDVESVMTVSRYLKQLKHVVFDTAFISSRGERIASEEIISHVCWSIIPLCDIVIIKLSEAELLLSRSIPTKEDMQVAGKELLKRFRVKAIIMRGSCDLFMQDDAAEFFVIPDYSNCDTHGLATTLSASIATYIAKSHPLPEAVRLAYNYLNALTIYNVATNGRETSIIGHQTRSKELYNSFMQLVSNHANVQHDVLFYAEKLNITPRYLSQITMSVSGKSPKELISDIIICDAMTMLASTTKSIQEIAFHLGFPSQAQFTRLFRQKKNLSPTEYRNSI